MSQVRIGIGADVGGALNGINRVNDHLQKFRTTAAQSTMTMTNFSRVVQDVPYGFIGIANNLNPLLESFQRLKATTGSSKEAFKALGASLMGPGGVGLLLGIVSSALVVFGDKLFGAKAKAEESKKALDELNKTLAEQKHRVDALASSIDFLNTINAIGIEINFGDDREGLGLRGQLVSGGNLLFQLQKEIAQVTETISKKGEALLNGEISEKDYNKQLEALYKQRSDLWKKQAETEQNQILLRAQLRLHDNRQAKKDAEEAKRLSEEAKRRWEEYVTKTIARGKELAKFFDGQGARKTPFFSIFDTRDEQFKKALDFIDEVNIGDVKVIFSPEFEVTRQASISAKIAEAIKKNPLTIGDTSGADKSRPGGSFFDAVKVNQAAIKGLREEMEKLIQAGQFVGNILANSFGSLFDAIASGENVFKSLGNAIKGLILDLIKAVVQSLILRAVTNAFLPGAGSAGISGFNFLTGLPRRAAGGPVTSRPYLIGENGPEIFVPSTSGRVVPNNRMSGLVGAAAQMINVVVTGRMQGNDLVLVQERVIRRNNRY